MDSDCTGGRIAMQFDTASQSKNGAGTCLITHGVTINTIPLR